MGRVPELLNSTAAYTAKTGAQSYGSHGTTGAKFFYLSGLAEIPTSRSQPQNSGNLRQTSDENRRSSDIQNGAGNPLRRAARLPGLKNGNETRGQNFVTSVKLNSRIFIAGTTMSNDSSPEARMGTLIASTFDSIEIRLSLKRKLRTPYRTRPFST